jgi:hypothetical protein
MNSFVGGIDFRTLPTPPRAPRDGRVPAAFAHRRRG